MPAFSSSSIDKVFLSCAIHSDRPPQSVKAQEIKNKNSGGVCPLEYIHINVGEGNMHYFTLHLAKDLNSN